MHAMDSIAEEGLCETPLYGADDAAKYSRVKAHTAMEKHDVRLALWQVEAVINLKDALAAIIRGVDVQHCPSPMLSHAPSILPHRTLVKPVPLLQPASHIPIRYVQCAA